MINEQFKFFIKNILNLDLEHDIIFMKDHNLKYVYANDRFCNIFGVTLDELIGKDDTYIMSSESFISKCRESDLLAIENNFYITSEIVDAITYKVLKLKIHLEANNFGLLCFAKIT